MESVGGEIDLCWYFYTNREKTLGGSGDDPAILEVCVS
jgi:hypothetical protein